MIAYVMLRASCSNGSSDAALFTEEKPWFTPEYILRCFSFVAVAHVYNSSKLSGENISSKVHWCIQKWPGNAPTFDSTVSDGGNVESIGMSAGNFLSPVPTVTIR